MTGDEALRILNQVTEIYNCLKNDFEREAFFKMGSLHEELSMIVRISETSFKSK
jgi:hypothetical protein